MLSINSTPDQIIKEGFQQVASFAPSGTENIVKAEVENLTSYGALIDRLDGPAHLAGDPAQKVGAAVLYGFLEKAGIDPAEWKLTVDPVVAGQVKYGPEEFNSARKFLGSWSRIAEVALIIAIAASFVIAGVAVYLAGAALTAITTALVAGAGTAEITAILNVAKFRGIKWLSVPAAILAMGTAVAYFSSTQITAVGDLETYVKQGVARGEAMAAGVGLTGSGSGGNSPDLPKTIIRMVTEEKPMQFIGTLFSSKLGSSEQFERVLDDKITDMNDLEADVKLNLNKWLATLPNRMGYSIGIRKDPVDEYGAQQSGIWATMTMFMTHISGKITPIDTVLLGPVEPMVRLELQKKTTTVENQISGFISATQVKEIQIPNGSVDIFNTAGERVTPSGSVTAPMAPAVVPKQFIEISPGNRVATAYASQEIKDAADRGTYKYVDDNAPAVNASGIPFAPKQDPSYDFGNMVFNEPNLRAGYVWVYDTQGRAAQHTQNSSLQSGWSYTRSAASSPPPATSVPAPTQAPVSGATTNAAAVRAQAATTLFDYYSAYGVSLPSVSQRAALYQGRGLGSAASYTGSAAQNDALLRSLKAGNVGADILRGA